MYIIENGFYSFETNQIILVDDLVDDSEKNVCMLLEEWEKQKQSETFSNSRKSRRYLNRDREA